MSTKSKVDLKEKLGFFTFSGSNNIVYQFKSIYYLFFLTNVVKLDVFWAGTILTIGTIWDAINDPLLGYWAVNHRFKSGESVRPFALWHSVPWAITVVLLFTDFHLSEIPAIILALVIYILFEVFNTFVGIPYNSMGGLASDLDSDRRSINVFRNLGGTLGSGIGALACLPLLKRFGALNREGNLTDTADSGFFKVAVIMGLIVIAGCLIHYFTTRERVKQVADDEEHLPFRTIATTLLKNKSWVINTLYIICYGVINLLLLTCVTYYATYVLGSTAAATSVQAAFLVSSLLSSFFVSKIDQKLGRRKTMMMAPLVSILGKIWFVLSPASTMAIYVNAVSVGISATIAFVLFNTNRNNLVDIVEADSGRRFDSMIASTDNLAAKLASAAATQFITISLAVAGFNAELPNQPAAAISVINFMLGIAPMAVSVLMLWAASRIPIEKELKAARIKLAKEN